MLRKTQSKFLARGHLAPTKPKYSDRPGVWGATGGQAKDTLARRWEFYKFVSMHKIGQVTKPLRTKKAVWMWRRFQARLWKTTVFTLMGISLLLLGNIWCLLAYHAYSVGPTTPVLERKVREHRVSKQIMGMVREREKELVSAKEEQEATDVLKARA